MSGNSPPVRHVVVANPLFDLALYLKNAIDCDKLDYLSPLSSPSSSPMPIADCDALDDLSPLTTPDSSPAFLAETSNLEPLPSDLASLTSVELSPLWLQTPTPAPQIPSSTTQSKVSKSKAPTNKKSSKKPEQRKARERAYKKAWRQNKRVEERDSIGSHYRARENAYHKYVENAEPIECSWDASEAAVSSTGFVAARGRRGLKKEYGLEELVGENSRFKF